jgi:glycosylphosphatidylinositol transamidase (GPIT) subunit GPI8
LILRERSCTGFYPPDYSNCTALRFRRPQVEISSQDIADALAQMAEKHRYREARPL